MTPQIVRREFGVEVLSKADFFVSLNGRIELRSRALSKLGLKPLDALHLASAEEAQADFLCTCDDKFLKKAQAISDLQTIVISPVELIEEIE